MDRIKLHGGFELKMDIPSAAIPIEEVPSPKNVIIPLTDEMGNQCRSLVEKGQIVSEGEKIAEDASDYMPPMHSPISGKVTDIKDVRYAEGGIGRSLILESDGLIPSENYLERTPVELIKSVRNAGVKLIPFETLPDAERPAENITPIKQFVITGIGNGFAGAIVRQLLVERSDDLLQGIDLIKKVFHPDQVYLAIDRRHEDAIQAIMDSGLGKSVEVVKLDVYYPLGHPYLLFKAIFNKEIPSPLGKAIPMGVAFASVDTALHALEAIRESKPMTERYVSVSGEGIQTPKNLKVRIGTPLKHIINFCGGFKGTPGRVVLGNPLNGSAQFSLDAPILKDTRWVWVQPEASVITEKYRSCISCGDCVDICPVRVMPNFLGKLCEFGQYEEAASQYDLYTCIECGLCTYVCPSRRPMVHFIKYGKWELALKEKENASE
jgi:electron transport complex protein RnfC